MTKAEEIKIQAVSPLSTFGGDFVSANATPAIKRLKNRTKIRYFFISSLLVEISNHFPCRGQGAKP
jgi:hypothetical protein